MNGFSTPPSPPNEDFRLSWGIRRGISSGVRNGSIVRRKPYIFEVALSRPFGDCSTRSYTGGGGREVNR